MFGMNNDQLTKTILPIISFFGGIAVSKGWIPAGTIDWLSNNIAAVLGAIGTVGALIVGFITSTKNAQITRVAEMPEVEKVKLEPSAPQAMVEGTPSNVSRTT